MEPRNTRPRELASTYGSGQGPPDVSELISIKIDNLAYDSQADSLREIFAKHGEIGDVFIPKDVYTQRSRGFAFGEPRGCRTVGLH